MECPRCDGNLVAKIYEGVEIDSCNKCGGHWLDFSELTKIIETLLILTYLCKNNVIKNGK